MCVALAFAKAVLSICSAPRLCFPAGAVGLGELCPPQGFLLGKGKQYFEGGKHHEETTIIGIAGIMYGGDATARNGMGSF